MQYLEDISQVERTDAVCLSSMTLDDIMATQREFDVDYFSGAVDDAGKRRHVTFHVGILAGKLLRIEERADHGPIPDEVYSVLVEEVIPDLLVYASQLAAIAGVSLDDAYRSRLQRLKIRDGSDRGHVLATYLPSTSRGTD